MLFLQDVAFLRNKNIIKGHALLKLSPFCTDEFDRYATLYKEALKEESSASVLADLIAKKMEEKDMEVVHLLKAIAGRLALHNDKSVV